ncbi:N-acetylglucosaminylphosphatidylinositoldeacety la se [Coprinopsis marcescibilis]|uniref:N-acetylglucosaminylphosphatidylinositol deacetylase n=1 Tax=Coprinopsis marcescibilis TaxID=230819 RepID=A0A5C3L1N6_COPMA|nr:N-acetylglucosaminylphosphatidylinositoldeacety la se [Coprinopsis marcescibilis]
MVSADNSRILLLTAHPDDEAMFFAPTLLALASSQTGANKPLEVFSLCVSVGNADGLGHIRPAELERSLEILGVVHKNRRIVDHPDLQDNFTALWDPKTIASVLHPYIIEHQIDTILTFDYGGISGHPNHRALQMGVQELWPLLQDQQRPRLFTLVTVPPIVKYSSVLAPALAKLDIHLSKVLKRVEVSLPPPQQAPMPVFISGVSQYKRGFKAMLAHKSQLVWFRWLYLLFSRYMWVNEWVEITP